MSSDARALLAGHLSRYRAYPYERLARLVGSCEAHEVPGRDGTTYQMEVEVFWDGKKGGDVRVVAAIDGGGIPALVPMTDSFLKAPDGTFVGE